MASTQIKIRNLQRKLYRVSKQKEGYQFYSLYDKTYRMDILREAYQKSKANRGKPGIDGKTFKDVEEAGVETFLIDISNALRERKYKPDIIKRVLIPKANGKKRPLGISTIRDRVVQTACKIVMEPIFEPHLHSQSYGYRPKMRAQEAVQEIDKAIKCGYNHVYDADLSGYFDTIPHQALMKKIKKRISDKQFLSLILKFLTNPVQVPQEGGKTICASSTVGTPQGNCLSPLFANIYLNDFCLKIANRTPCKIITYADDFVIMHRTPFTREQEVWFSECLSREGLKINPEKTKIVDMRRAKSNFDFLGFSFKRVKSFHGRGHYVKIQPSAKSQAKLKEKISNIVKHRTSLKLDQLIARVNPVLRGWHNYFKGTGYPRQVFFKMDWFVVGRFYRWSKKRSQRGSKYLTQDAWKKLRYEKLIFLQPCFGRITAKVTR